MSSSSSSSLLDSSILGASALNRQKADRQVRGRQLFWESSDAASVEAVGDGNAGDSRDDVHHHLLGKRLYHIPSISDNKPKEATEQVEAKTEVETAVLMDCLSNNFLLAHLPPNELRSLCGGFEKRRYRNHEVIFGQGDPADYVYILYSGEVVQRVDGKKKQQEDGKYTVLGELAVLTGSPHQETVHATSPCTLFRLGRGPFHRALRPSPEIGSEERLELLRAAIPEDLLSHFSDVALRKLASDMSAHSFQSGDVLVEKKTRLESLVIIAKGLAVATDISLGGRSYDDKSFGPGASRISFGWQSILAGSEEEPAFQGKIVAHSDGTALKLTQQAFRNALGGDHAFTMQNLAARRLARIQLEQIPIFQDSCLEDAQFNGLLDLMHHCEYFSSTSQTEGMTIFKAGEKVEAAMYFVREGGVTLEMNKGETRQTIEPGGYFGESNMLRDQNKDGKKHYVIRSPMTAVAHAPRTTLNVLYLEECRAVVDTTVLGLGRPITVSATNASIQWSDLDCHTLLGIGKFGQVWLASTRLEEQEPDILSLEEKETKNDTESKRRIVALKVQAKYELIQSEKAERFVAERNILASLHSPFILRLFSAFQDDSRLYMITSLLQGGELESIIPEDGLSESAAKFYAAGILEGLSYMHKRHIIHRDLKATNVLINDRGYPVLIDFGFAKYVPDKTFTFCGSPMFTAPEIIRYKGHDKGCDNWAFGVLTYRMVTGKYPFYKEGIDELTLYKRICKGTFELDGLMSLEFRMLMVAILYPDPAQRLGSHVNGWRDIFGSPWFVNDNSFNLQRLRRQDIPAPWIPGLKDSLDASRFHPDASDKGDLMSKSFPMITDEQQKVFSSFGPKICSPPWS